MNAQDLYINFVNAHYFPHWFLSATSEIMKKQPLDDDPKAATSRKRRLAMLNKKNIMLEQNVFNNKS